MPTTTITDFHKAFSLAIERAGLTPPETIVADAKIHRFASNGDPDDDSGWYALFNDGLPAAGSFGDWRSGLKQNWCAKSDRQMSETERADYQARCEAARQQRDAEESKRHAEAAARARPSGKPRHWRRRVTPISSANMFIPTVCGWMRTAI